MAADDANQNGMNLPWLESASFWANVAVVVFGVLAAVAAVFALYFSLKRDSAKDAELIKFQQTSRVSIANADARAAEANEKAAAAGEGTAKALAEAANANARTQLLEVEAAGQKERAATAEKDLLALRQKIAPRRLTAEQKTKLTSALRPFSPAPINLAWAGPGGQESADLASDIIDAITSAGIPIPSRNILMDQYFKRVFMRAGTARMPEAEVIAAFLIESGLADKPVLVEPNADQQFLTILIGSKP
jgi:hypothetical protein